MTAGLTVPHPLASITGAAMKTNEETVGYEKKRYCNSITAQYSKGKIQWDFDIDDVRSQKKGLFMPADDLPAVRFMFIGKSGDDEPAPPPNNMDIVITSYWKMISQSDPKSNWIHKLLQSLRSNGDTQTISYSNLLQIVALDADLSKLSKLSKPAIYQATVKFKPGTDDPHKVIDNHTPPKDSVCVTPSVVCT